MTSPLKEFLPLLLVGAIGATLLLLFVTLDILTMRDRVKRAIIEQGFEPLQVRWRPWAYWLPSILVGGGRAFEGLYADASGATYRGRFMVWSWSRNVWWVPPGASYFGPPMSRWSQVVCGGVAALCLYLGTKYLLGHEIYFRPGWMRTHGVHIHGGAKALFCLALFCIAGEFLSLLAYHHRRPASESNYRRADRAFSFAGGFLLILSVVVYILQGLP